jgi:hypothetical protein
LPLHGKTGTFGIQSSKLRTTSGSDRGACMFTIPFAAS